MPFSGFDDLINETQTNSKFATIPFYRVPMTGATSVAGRWHECFTGGGTGGVGVLTGVAGTGTALTRASAGALPLNADVSPDTRHLLSMAAVTSGTTIVPAYLLLTDLLYFYPSCVVTGAATTLSNVASKPTRYGTGIGVVCSCVVVGAIGAATPLLTVTYTDSGGAGSNTCTVSSSANSLPVGSFFTGAPAASILGGPWAAWATQDVGIQQLDSYAITSGGTTGTVTFVLHRPIAYLPLPAGYVAGERDYITQIPKLPKIEDDACLAFFVGIGGAMTANQVISGEINYGWG